MTSQMNKNKLIIPICAIKMSLAANLWQNTNFRWPLTKLTWRWSLNTRLNEGLSANISGDIVANWGGGGGFDTLLRAGHRFRFLLCRWSDGGCDSLVPIHLLYHWTHNIRRPHLAPTEMAVPCRRPFGAQPRVCWAWVRYWKPRRWQPLAVYLL